MRIGFREADWSALVRLWNEYYAPQYRVDGALLEQHTVGSPTFDWGASAIEVCDDDVWGFLAMKRSPNPRLWPGPHKDTYHLCGIAYREPEVGIDLMSGAKKVLRERGAQRIVFGQDSLHLFPGCPEDCPKVCDFLMVEGFDKSGEHFDLERDLDDYEAPASRPGSVRFREVVEADTVEVKAFLQREFPGRWSHDVCDKIACEGASNTCFGAFDGGRVVGFALLQDWRHRLPIGGAVWKESLGDRWGSLGPIGVAREERGKGIGDALLAAALSNLKGRGVRRCIIDWTTLKDFYGRHGFQITRRYTTATLRLD